jgi:cell wall-associated NlpC family hydrolase
MLRRAAATFGVLLALASPAAAQAPTPAAENRLADAQRRLDELNLETERAAERFNHANTRVDEARRDEDRLNASIVGLERSLSDSRQEVARLAVLAYKRGPVSIGVLLDADTWSTVIERSRYLGAMATREGARLDAFRAARSDVEGERNALAQVQRQAEAELADADLHRGKIESLLADQRVLVSQYADEVRQIQAERDAEAAAARLKAEAAAQVVVAESPPTPAHPPAPTSTAKDEDTSPPSTAPASSGGTTAVEWARRQLGKPYEYGANGPDSFDCSGLVQYVWGRAGVSLTHGADSQYYETTKVRRDQLQPGDIVYFGADLHHNGIYVGNNTMIHAPQTGRTVEYQDIDRQDYFGASRPGV